MPGPKKRKTTTVSAAANPARFPWRALLYTVVIFYLVTDLYWCEGPLRQRIDQRKAFTKYSRQRALENGWVATVNNRPLTRGQLDQATAIYLHRRGKTPADISAAGLRIARRVALGQLIDDTLVAQYARAEEFQPDPESVRARIAAFEAQFADPADLAARREALGLSEAKLHALLADQVLVEQWIASRIAEAAAVSEDDLRAWFDENAATDPGAENPPLIRARHLFLSTVEEDTPEREAKIREMHGQLESDDADFETLAAAFSDDERTKHHGGDLGWFGVARMPRDFADVAFGLRSRQRSEPFRSSLGWHIVEVTDSRPAERLDFETLKPEIAAWLDTERRRYAVAVLLYRLKKVAVVELFPENFDHPVTSKSGTEEIAPSP